MCIYIILNILKLTYNTLTILKVYNLVSFARCVHQRNYYNEDNEYILHS